MNFVQLRELAEEYAEIWGYSNTERLPDWYSLINEAYRDIAWASEIIRGPQYSFSTVVGQAEYDLPTVISGNTRDWKSVFDVLYNDVEIREADEDVIRRDDPLWMTRTSGTPTRWWIPRFNILRLHYVPDAIGTIKIYGTQEPIALSADTDTPKFGKSYQRGISKLAAKLHAEKYAKTDQQLKHIAKVESDIETLINNLIQDVAEDMTMSGTRSVEPIEPTRIYV